MDVVTDPHMMKMSSVLVDKDCLVIGISLSGKTQEVLECLCAAKKNRAKVVFVTSDVEPEVAEYCDEILQVAYMKNLDFGTKISPQFSMLVMFDVLYTYYMENDSYTKLQKYKDTLSALRGK